MSAFDTEKAAMVGDRSAVLLLVSAVRAYRSATADLLAARYTDGEVDRIALSSFEYATKAAERLLEDES